MSLLGEVQKAYEFFKANGWIQGTMVWKEAGVNSYCSEGVAFYYDAQPVENCENYNHFFGPHEHRSPHYEQVRKELETTLVNMGFAFPVLVDWNDADGRTREEVDELWQETIRRIKEKEGTRVPVSA